MFTVNKKPSAVAPLSSQPQAGSVAAAMANFDSSRTLLPQDTAGQDAVVLRVGNHTFHTTTRTLLRCQYFKDFLYPRSSKLSTQESYFVDADGDMFDHVLSYLRSGQLPLLWTKSEGFNYGAYARLRNQAAFFGCKDLADWITAKQYHSVVQERRIYKIEDVDDATVSSKSINMVMLPGQTKRVVSIHSIQASEGTQLAKVPQVTNYSCPRNISSHRCQEKCGRKCLQAAKVDSNNITAAGGAMVTAKTRFLVELSEYEVDFSKLGGLP